jgi:magnesium transporter
MFSDSRKRLKKVGQPPGTPIYTGAKQIESRIQVISFNQHDFHEVSGKKLSECLPETIEPGLSIWMNVQGLSDTKLIDDIAKRFKLHPLTVEDILNVSQRPKVEEFDHYLFITLKVLLWKSHSSTFSVRQLSLVLGSDFVLSFQDGETPYFDSVKERLQASSGQRLREHGTDYLTYRLIDSVVDRYFVILEAIGDEIEKVEERIVSSPTQQTMKTIYRLKRQLLILRKSIWPMREAIGHLAHVEGKLVAPFTRVYLRDVYDHTVQAIDTLETFRDMLASMMDMYLSSLTNRMNEIMKTLTIIATIFIPITTVASIYGMNFEYMPELKWHWGYPMVLCVMFAIMASMMLYFWRKKWI